MLRLLIATSLFDLALLNYSVLKLILRSWWIQLWRARLGLPSCHPDVVILDISMQDESGLKFVGEIPSGIASIMLSVHDSPAMVEKSLELGAKGYLSKL